MIPVIVKKWTTAPDTVAAFPLITHKHEDSYINHVRHERIYINTKDMEGKR